MTVFPESTVRWDEDLLTNGHASTETLVKVGMKVGRSIKGEITPPAKSGSKSSASSSTRNGGASASGSPSPATSSQ